MFICCFVALQFNAGSALAANALAGQVFMNTNAAAASAMFSWMLMDHLRGHKLRATGACVGAVIGLVAITPAAGENRPSKLQYGGSGGRLHIRSSETPLF
jgi:ammonia channel protein AmtB